MAADFKSLGKNEQGALIAGGVAIILSFFPRYISYDLGPLGGDSGNSAWESYATFGMLLVVAAIAILAIRTFAADVLPKELPWNLITLGLAGFGTLLVIVRALTWPGVGNPGWSGYVLFAALAAFTYFAFTLFKASGESVPDLNKKDTPPAA